MARMETQEKEAMLADLHRGREALLAVLSEVAQEDATWHPGPGRWSVLDCVEHLVVSEDYFLSQIRAAQPTATPTRNDQREALIATRGLDRTRPVPSPEVGLPTGRFATLAAAQQHFLESRAQTVRFVEDCTQDLCCAVTTHPLLGTVNCHEMLLMLSVHPHRHAQQIQEITASRSSLHPWSEPKTTTA
jgi:DinB superfamily